MAKSLGRKPLTQGQIKQIDADMSATLRRLSRTQQDWQALTRDQRIQAATKSLMLGIEADAKRMEENAMRQVIAQAQTGNRLVTIQAATKGGSLTDATKRDFANMHRVITQIRHSAMASLMDTVTAVSDKAGAGLGQRALMNLFDAENPVMARDLIREIYKGADGHTGNKLAQDGARAWLDTAETLRTRFNAAGGDVGKLDYGWAPRSWDASRVRKAGADAWAADMLPEVDRTRMLHEDGSQMDDGMVLAFLKASWKTISTEGVNGMTPGEFTGSGKRANRGSESRLIHFKDGEADLRMRAKYGRGGTFEAMSAHVGAMARNIGLVERYGPDPNATARLRFDTIAKNEGVKYEKSIGATEIDPKTYWDMISGKTTTPHSERLADWGQTARNVQTFGKLGGAMISGLTDIATAVLTTGYNRMSYWELLKDVGGQMGSKEARDWMTTQEIVSEHAGHGLDRWSGDMLGQNWSGKLANATMKLSLMNRWTDGMRQGFNMALAHKLSQMAKKGWAELDEFDRRRLQRHGIDEADWTVMQNTTMAQRGGREYLTPAAVDSVSDADVQRLRAGEMQAISDRINKQTQDLLDRNARDQGWVTGRIDKFDDARDALNRAVKKRAAGREAKAQDSAGPLLERMALLDAQREAAKLQTDMEADFNRYTTQDEVRAFLNAVEDGASADKTARGAGGQAVRTGLESAEAAGRRYGEAKGRLERRMVEMENRIVKLDAEAKSATNEDAKAAQKKADAMMKDLKEFITNSQERQARRQAVVSRLQAEEAPRLTAEAKRIRRDVADKLGAFIMDEGEYAVVNPDLRTRALITGGGQQVGTPMGEIARTVTHFKSFPVALISRHWGRMLEGGAPGGPVLANRAAYGFALLASTMALGAVVTQAKQMLAGKDPVDMTGDHAGRFWGKALTQGGGLGIMGDLFFIDPAGSYTDAGTTLIKNLAGPTVGTFAEAVVKGGIENVWEAAAGKDTHAGAELFNVAKGLTPGVGVWWVKPFLEHGVTHALQENMSPGYLSRMRSRARKDWGNDFWWRPGETMPDRAPDIPHAAENLMR